MIPKRPSRAQGAGKSRIPPANQTVHQLLEALLLELRDLRQQLDIDPRRRIAPYTVKELAVLARRHPDYIYDRCRIGTIKVLPGKPYRIPP